MASRVASQMEMGSIVAKGTSQRTFEALRREVSKDSLALATRETTEGRITVRISRETLTTTTADENEAIMANAGLSRKASKKVI